MRWLEVVQGVLIILRVSATHWRTLSSNTSISMATIQMTGTFGQSLSQRCTVDPHCLYCAPSEHLCWSLSKASEAFRWTLSNWHIVLFYRSGQTSCLMLRCVGYVQRFCNILLKWDGSPFFGSWPGDAGEEIMVSNSYDQAPFFTNWRYW